jgi:alcohol dehydrogenase, propanol-preferring
MRAMVLDGPSRPLRAAEVPPPTPGFGELLIAVRACAVCRTDLHIIDGELAGPLRPLILGHQIAGTVVGRGPGTSRFAAGDRVGVPWLGWTDGTCRYCRQGRENLCTQARFTGYTQNGGYAELVVADERFCLALPASYSDVDVAPLLCAGLIGYRALKLAGDAPRIGLYGFGSSAHIIAQVARHRGQRVFAFTRGGDVRTQSFARSLGAEWAGGSDARPPEPLDAAIIFAAAGELVPVALGALDRGGTVVCAGIHMSDIPSIPYEMLWEERAIRSVANLTRQDGEEFFAVAPAVPVRTTTTSYPLDRANDAIDDLRHGRLEGSAALLPAGSGV